MIILINICLVIMAGLTVALALNRISPTRTFGICMLCVMTIALSPGITAEGRQQLVADYEYAITVNRPESVTPENLKMFFLFLLVLSVILTITPSRFYEFRGKR